MPFDVVVGKYNPLALPVRLELDPPRALGHAVFTTPYEGAPGCVHGASIAGAFDIVSRRPTWSQELQDPPFDWRCGSAARPCSEPSHSSRRGWTKGPKGGSTRSGRLIQNGQVTVEAEGEFASLDMEQIASLHRR